MKVPILSGMGTDNDSDIRTSYPRNYIPVPANSGINTGYLRPADGIVDFNKATPGLTRGGIRWNNICYRVLGLQLCSLTSDGTVTQLGNVGGSNQVSLDYSFDYLAIASNNNLFLYDGTTLTQVTDPDVGTVLDVLWVDGYFMVTDGNTIAVTELANPFSVLSTKYGSSEFDSDPIKALIKIKNEVYALNRYTIEVFENIGGSGFPFQVIDGAVITRGVVGTHACCEFNDTLIFLGSKKNEPLAIWQGINGTTSKISSREIDKVIKSYTEAQLAAVVIEPRIDESHEFVYVHFPDTTWVFDAGSSTVTRELIWFELSSTILDQSSQFLAKDFVWCYDKWLVGHPTLFKTGYFVEDISSHWGNEISWRFQTAIIYNDGFGALIHELELVALTGRAALGDEGALWTSYSNSGIESSFSQEKSISPGKKGQYTKRLVWLQQGPINHYRIQKFRGTSKAHMSVIRLELQLEGLYI